MKKLLINRKRLMQFALRLCLILVSANSSWGQGVTKTTPGTYTYTVPAGVTSIKLEAWGGGGAGGSASIGSTAYNVRGGGGAGGSYASTIISVTPGDVINYTVGAGASPLSTFSTGNVAAGALSSANLNGGANVLKALGGNGGLCSAATTGAVNSIGGAAFTSENIGPTSFYGGSGGNAATGGSGGGGGSAGTASNGGNGSITLAGTAGTTGGAAGGAPVNTSGTAAAGLVGGLPGGGGSGASIRGGTNTSVLGGSGGAGKVVISYPIISNTGSFSSLSTVAGVASGSTSIGVTGADMQSAITATASAGFEVSINDSSFSSDITSIATSGTSTFTVYVRLAASALEGTYASGTVTFTGTNAAPVAATIPSSTVSSASAAGITVSTTSLSTSFAKTTAGANSSTSQSFTVSGVNLGTNAITIAAPTHFKISLTDVDANYSSNSIVLTPSSGTVGINTIYVKYSPTGSGNISGNSDSISITHESVATQTVSVSGSGLNAFYYNSGSLATLGSWKALSGGSGDSPADFTTAGITYTILANATTDASWSVSGASSKIVVGNGSAVTLTVADTFPIIGTIDAAANASIIWKHEAVPPTFGILHSNSEVHLQPTTPAIGLTSVTYAIPGTSFGKLFIDGAAPINLSNGHTVNTLFSVAEGSQLILPTQTTHFIYINTGASATINGTVRSIKKTGIFSFNITTPNGNTGIQFKDLTPSLTLGATSTIDYSSINGTQTISSLPSGISYANLTISENGTNITSSSIKAFPTLIITGTLTINTPGNVTYASSTTGAESITLGNGATIVRTLGTLNAAPSYSGTYNVTYNGKLTTAASANTTMASTNVTLTSANTTIVAGMNVTGTAVATGTTVASISGTSLVLSQNATLTATAVALTFEKAIAQTTGLELPTVASVLNNLTIDNPAGVILNLDTSVNNDLTLGVGSALTIPTEKNLTVDNTIVNNGTITIENNANLVQTAVANTNSGSGTAIVKRNSASIQLYDYTLWSSPVAGQNLKLFSPETLNSRFYSYDSSQNLYSAVDPLNTSFSPATSYLIRAPNDWIAGATAAPFSGTFTGVPNNGTITLSELTSSSFYAVGNPYPSTISAAAFYTENASAGTLYFWRRTNGNISTTAYATLNRAGSTTTSFGLTPSADIAVGQGFIVSPGATTLSFKNAMRSSNTSATFLRTTEDRSRFWLNLTSTTGAFCQTMVAYMPEATSGFDNAIDGKYINDAPIALTSIINAEEYTIQGRALPFATLDTVPLGFKTNAAGNYTIAIDHVDGLFSSGQAIYLKDNLLNTVNNLSAGSYSFASAIGTFNSRFEVVYQSTLAETNPTFTANSVIAFSENGEIRINSGSTIMELVRVYDLQGRLLVEKKQINSSETKLSTTATNQVLLLEITAANGLKVTKKIIQ